MRALDGREKKWYDYSMEYHTEINKIIAKNLTYYRKKEGLTQAELAERINYSDKSVSKWESGNGVPDVYTLTLLAEIYGVTLNDLVGVDTPMRQEKKTKDLHFWVILLSIGIVWLAATCFFVGMQLWRPRHAWWIGFLYAGMISAVVMTVFASVWKYRVLNIISVSLLIWTSICALYFTLWYLYANVGRSLSYLWLIFLLGAPLQVLEVMWWYFRQRARKFARSENAFANKRNIEEKGLEEPKNGE